MCRPTAESCYWVRTLARADLLRRGEPPAFFHEPRAKGFNRRVSRSRIGVKQIVVVGWNEAVRGQEMSRPDVGLDERPCSDCHAKAGVRSRQHIVSVVEKGVRGRFAG